MNQLRSHSTKPWVATLVVLALPCLGWYATKAFKTEIIESPNGLFYYHYRWNELQRIEVDQNRDGRVDATGELEDGTYPVRYEEDSNRDGRFDLHGSFVNGCLEELQVDENHDGAFDTSLHGREARSFFASRVFGPGATLEMAECGPIY